MLIDPLPSNHRVLIVDDEHAVHDRLHRILGSEPASETVQLPNLRKPILPEVAFELTSAYQGQEGLLAVTEAKYSGSPFAIAFVDNNMPPGWDGIKTVQHLWEADPELQIIFSTDQEEYSPAEIVEALGISDKLAILKKPFDTEEIRLACLSLSEKWRLSHMAAMHTSQLEQHLAMRTQEIVSTRDLTVFALAELADSRDPETGEHLVRMREYSQLLADELSEWGPYRAQIDQKFLEDLYRSSPLHDIGKVGIEDSILLKPGKLTDKEFDLMKLHVLIGANSLRSAAAHTAGGFLEMAVDIAQFHHERFNGSGYLCGLRGLEIPLPARIVALADVFDALTSDRVYKRAITPAVAKEMIDEECGKHFDPVVVDAFHRSFDNFLEAGRFKDENSVREIADNPRNSIMQTVELPKPEADQLEEDANNPETAGTV